MNEFLVGIITGILFGFLMQKGQVLRYDRQLGALRLKDMTIVKFMLTAILVAMVGIYLLLDLGLVKLSVKPLVLGGNIWGGLIFGVGWAIVGYCPATARSLFMQSSGDVCKNQFFAEIASICSSGAGNGIQTGVSISKKLRMSEISEDSGSAGSKGLGKLHQHFDTGRFRSFYPVR